ncbi:DNA-binding response regulator [Clostridium sp. W14A]|nr:DNA-binding response regulator [Clostridium sp. W14A]
MYKILIAEDEDIIRKGLVFSIPWAQMDCSVIDEVRNGVEGIEKIREHQPDILIVDVNMPVMDGLEMIRQTYEKYDYIAIILSGYSNFQYAQQAICCGAMGYLLKPLKIEELKDAILRAQKECEVRRAYVNKQFSKEEWKHFNLLKEGREAAGSDEVAQRMLDYIAAHYREKIILQDVVKQLSYSETLLNKRFKEATGITFIEYLNRYRIQKALKLLQNRHGTISEVAWECGIGDYKYFGTVFKKYIGCSPKEYLTEIGGL